MKQSRKTNWTLLFLECCHYVPYWKCSFERNFVIEYCATLPQVLSVIGAHIWIDICTTKLFEILR